MLNLKVEMVRKGITRYDLADVLNVSYATACRKVKGERDFTLAEAVKIQTELFPDVAIDILFKKEKELN